MPANWEEEEKKFFEAIEKGEIYNPQLLYHGPVTSRASVKQFAAPKHDLFDQSIKIMEAFLNHYGSHSKYLKKMGATITDQEEVEKRIHEYLNELGPKIREVGKVNFSDKLIAATSVSYITDE
jgi:hypothetical protein